MGLLLFLLLTVSISSSAHTLTGRLVVLWDVGLSETYLSYSHASDGSITAIEAQYLRLEGRATNVDFIVGLSPANTILIARVVERE